MSHGKGKIRWENPHIDVVYFRSASVYIITLNRLHYFPCYKSQTHTMSVTSQDYSEWDFRKTWRSDGKRLA